MSRLYQILVALTAILMMLATSCFGQPQGGQQSGGGIWWPGGGGGGGGQGRGPCIPCDRLVWAVLGIDAPSHFHSTGCTATPPF